MVHDRRSQGLGGRRWTVSIPMVVKHVARGLELEGWEEVRFCMTEAGYYAPE